MCKRLFSLIHFEQFATWVGGIHWQIIDQIGYVHFRYIGGEEGLWLHCIRYKGSNWVYECPLPQWALWHGFLIIFYGVFLIFLREFKSRHDVKLSSYCHVCYFSLVLKVLHVMWSCSGEITTLGDPYVLRFGRVSEMGLSAPDRPSQLCSLLNLEWSNVIMTPVFMVSLFWL